MKNKKNIIKYSILGALLILINVIILNFNSYYKDKPRIIENALNSIMNKDIPVNGVGDIHIQSKNGFSCIGDMYTMLGGPVKCNASDNIIVIGIGESKELKKIEFDMTLDIKIGTYDKDFIQGIRNKSNISLKIKPKSNVSDSEELKDIIISFDLNTSRLNKNETTMTAIIEAKNENISIKQKLVFIYDYLNTKDITILENAGALNTSNPDKIINIGYDIYVKTMEMSSNEDKRMINVSYLNYNSYNIASRDDFIVKLKPLIKIASNEYAYSNMAIYVNFLNGIMNNKKEIYIKTYAKSIDLAMTYEDIVKITNERPDIANEEISKRYNYILSEDPKYKF